MIDVRVAYVLFNIYNTSRSLFVRLFAA